MSDAPVDRPRSWGPFAAAAAIGLLVLVGAVVAFVLAGGPDEQEAAVIAACEAEHAATDNPAIVSGQVYDPTQWRDHYGVAETHAEAPPIESLSEQSESAQEALADVYRDTGDGDMIIVWRLDDDSFLQCTASVTGDVVQEESAEVGPVNTPIVEPAE